MRGRVIVPPDNLPVRPTTDFAKTALFNILNNHFDFESIDVLDLFAGTGAISYEFISRGSPSVTAVDENIQCVNFIKKTLTDFRMTGLQVIRTDAFDYIRNGTKQYDIIFADPPFSLEETNLLPDLVFEKNSLKKDGWLIIEHQTKRILQSNVQPFQVRKYSNCSYSFYKSQA